MLFTVEGNIAVGKSTFLTSINAQKAMFEKLGYEVVVVLEGVERWCNTIDPVTGKSILALFYSDQSRYGFMFQIEAFSSRVIDLKAVIEMAKRPNTIVIMERSPYSDRYIFAELLHKTGKISGMEHRIYCNLWDLVAKEILEVHVTGILYLHVPPAIALERLHKRNRLGEEDIPLSYLEQLHEQHEQFIANTERAKPVYKIDTSLPINMEALVKFLTAKFRMNIKKQLPSITPAVDFADVDIVAFNFSGVLTTVEGSRILMRLEKSKINEEFTDMVAGLALFDEERAQAVAKMLSYFIEDGKKVCIVSNLYRDVVEEACRIAFPEICDDLEIHTCRGSFAMSMDDPFTKVRVTKSEIIGSLKEHGKLCYIDDSQEDLQYVHADHPDVITINAHKPFTLDDLVELNPN